MEPLSIALTVISISTAIKDLVKLAQDICDAFSKVDILYFSYFARMARFDITTSLYFSIYDRPPRNYRNAVNLASDISRTLKQMHMLYAKKDIFESAEDLKASLGELYQ